MIMREVIKALFAPRVIGPYSQAIKAGEYIFCSGQIPLDAAGNFIGSDDVAIQTEQVLQNLLEVLKAAGASKEHVVSVTVYLIDPIDFSKMNEVYAKFFSVAPPARACIGVAWLPQGARVEMTAIAYRPKLI